MSERHAFTNPLTPTIKRYVGRNSSELSSNAPIDYLMEEVLRLAAQEKALKEALVDIIDAHCSGAQTARDEAIERAQSLFREG